LISLDLSGNGKGSALAEPFLFLLPKFRISNPAIKHAKFLWVLWLGRPLESAVITLV
jgi:hypothetical protein